MLYLSVKFKEQQSMLTPDKIIEIFVKVDDFCKEFEAEITKHQLDAGNYKVRDRKESLADSEVHYHFDRLSQRAFYQSQALLFSSYLLLLQKFLSGLGVL